MVYNGMWIYNLRICCFNIQFLCPINLTRACISDIIVYVSPILWIFFL